MSFWGRWFSLIERDFNLDLILSDSQIQRTNIKMVQYDSNAYVVNIKVFEDEETEIDYSTVDKATIAISKPDGTLVLRDLEKTGTGFVYNVEFNELTYAGTAIASVQLYDIDSRLSTARFRFEIIQDLINPILVKSTSEFAILSKIANDIEVAEAERNDAETARQENEAIRQANEAVRQQNETGRVSAEALRATAEDIRQQSENNRVDAENERKEAENLRHNAEQQRIENENQRKDAEASRAEAESTRQANENTRIQSENNRISAENIREENEDERITAENTRKAQETGRVSAESERVNAENTRVSHENTRITAENTRSTNETTRQNNEAGRVSAENIRITNETTRQSNEAGRVAAENVRNTNEATRQNNEAGRVSAENLRAAAEAIRQQNELAREENEILRQQRIADLEEIDAVQFQTRLLNVEEQMQFPTTFDFAFDDNGLFKKLSETYSTPEGDAVEYVEVLARERNLVTKIREHVRRGGTFKTFEYSYLYAVDITDGVCNVQISKITRREIA